MTDSANKRIIKNTIYLYARMFILLLISLFTSRIVLATLGIENYGIYNVVGSIVVMFTFLNNAMINSSQRYITYELGKGDSKRLNKLFCTCINIHAIIAFIIIILTETVGLWFLYNKMVIPESRIEAAFWVLQFSILSTVVSVINVPYNALIIAHEKMSAFAYLSIFDAVCKLLIIAIITLVKYDKLIIYSLLIFIFGIINQFIYVTYCKKNFKESYYHYYKDKVLTKELLNFASWNLIGNLAWIASTQGLNMLLNTFFNPIINAARGVAVQIQTVLINFSANIDNAIKPQITKSYALTNNSRMSLLTFASARFSFFALLFISLPIMFEIDQILNLWLKEVPPHTESFVILIMIISLIDTLTNPLLTLVQATGNVKKYQLIVGTTFLMIVPISYIGLKYLCIPELVFIINLIFSIIVMILKIYIVSPMVNIEKLLFYQKVIKPAFIVSIISSSIVLVTKLLLSDSLLSSFIILIVSTISIIISIYNFGISINERNFIKLKVKTILSNRLKYDNQ